jgi:hypothetical protein
VLCPCINSFRVAADCGANSTLFPVGCFCVLGSEASLSDFDSGAAQASGCKVTITSLGQSFDLRQNKALGVLSSFLFEFDVNITIEQGMKLRISC